MLEEKCRACHITKFVFKLSIQTVIRSFVRVSIKLYSKFIRVSLNDAILMLSNIEHDVVYYFVYVFMKFLHCKSYFTCEMEHAWGNVEN